MVKLAHTKISFVNFSEYFFAQLKSMLVVWSQKVWKYESFLKYETDFWNGKGHKISLVQVVLGDKIIGKGLTKGEVKEYNLLI